MVDPDSGSGPAPGSGEASPVAEGLQRELAGMTGRATSQRGYVVAAIGSDGRLASVDISPQAGRLSTHDLEAEVVDAVRAAQDDFASQVRAAVENGELTAGFATTKDPNEALESVRRAQSRVEEQASRVLGDIDRIRERFLRR